MSLPLLLKRKSKKKKRRGECARRKGLGEKMQQRQKVRGARNRWHRERLGLPSRGRGHFMSCCNRCSGFTLDSTPVSSQWATCVKGKDAFAIPRCSRSALCPTCVRHSCSFTQTHTHSQTHNKLFAPMIHERDNSFRCVLSVWRNTPENLFTGHNSERGWRDGAPVGAMMVEHD